MADKKNAPIDERGHSVADAEAQHPLLDASAKAASVKYPVGGEDVMVPAQTPEEVEAQIVNRPGNPDDEHDYAKQAKLARPAPITDDMHGHPAATSAADRDARAQLRVGNENAEEDKSE